MASMGQLQLTCFGAFQVVLNGALLTFPTEKVRALLVYLVVERQPQQRSALAQLLWPGYTAESANTSLRQTLRRLRKLLGDDEDAPNATPWLLVTRQTVQFNPAALLSADVITFTELLAACAAHTHSNIGACQPCLPRLQQAVDLYRGDFLSGFTVADSDGFEGWRRITQEQCHLQTLDALTHLAAAAENAGDDEAALQAAQRQLTLEPWLEAAHRCVMRVLARRGQRAAALAQYRRCRQVLADEFGVEPEAETTALYEQIRSGALPDAGQKQHGAALDEPTRQCSAAGINLGVATVNTGRQAERRPTRASIRPTGLPPQLTPLIGRAQEVADITALLQQPEVRLLTIVGAGGMGKTRLAIEVGQMNQTTFADGVCFVELAAIGTTTALAAAIATALGIPLQGGEPRTLLRQALGQQHLLLILDNFEQLLGHAATAVDLIAELLTTAPEIQILITSRERLQLRYEQIYTVQALAFALDTPLAEATHLAAVRLFVQAARGVAAHFQLTAENLPSVLQICHLVQGMPLGLELAAANVDQLPLVTIAATIARNAEFLAVDWRNLPERQRSMRAVFQWSWQLLTDQERQIFRQLAIFEGRFTRTAAEVVAGAKPAVLTRLLHKSLLQVSDLNAVDGRYQIHELLRQFAAAELAIVQEVGATANRHSTYYLSFLATQQQPIMHNAPREATAAIQAELDNIRQAWRWGAGHLPAALVEQGALALREFYWLTGLATEAIEMFTWAMQARTAYLEQQHPTLLSTAHAQTPQADQPANQPTSQPTSQQAEARVYSILLGMTAAFQMVVGRHEETLVFATQITGMASAASNPVGVAFAYMLQGQALRRQGKSNEALALLTESVMLARQERVVNPSFMLDIEKRAYSWLASIALSSDDYGAARAHAVYQLEICRQFHMRVWEVIALTCVIDVDKTLGDYRRAQQYAEQALTIARQVNFLWGQAICSEHLAELAWRQGDYQQAFQLYEQALAIFRPMDRLLEESNVAQMLGRLWLWLGDVDQAREWIEHAFQLLQRLGLPARETSWLYASRARLHFFTDNPGEALVDAETAWMMVRELDGGASQADALVLLGLLRERMQQWDGATAAFREALTIYTSLDHRHQTAEPRAGLARIALAKGALDSALVTVEALLELLQSHPLAGFDEPFQVYLTCYRVLAAAHDPRAMALIVTAHEQLMAYADRLVDPALRQSFLANVASHRAVAEALVQAQTMGERESEVVMRTFDSR